MQNISFDSAIDRLKNLAILPLYKECEFINQCVGRVLYSDIIARESNPKFHTSNMDGYAFNSQDLGALASDGLKIASINKAGNAMPCEVKKGECIKTFTGAMMPKNADCLAIIEQVNIKDSRIFLRQNENISPLNHIRKMGENYQKGDVLLRKGEILSPYSMAILCENHNVLLEVYRKIRIGILSGGDELLELGEIPQRENYIYSSNNHTLKALADTLGAEGKIYPLLKDSRANIADSIKNALQDNDIIITTGGMSKGDFDFTKNVLNDFGECIFYGVNIKPGKASAVVKCKDNKFILALPGNPSASIVSFLLFGRIIMQKMLSIPPQIPLKKAKLLSDFDNSKNARLCFELSHLSVESGFYAINPAKNRSSYMTNDLSGAYAILSKQCYKKGDFVDIILLQDLLTLGGF